MTHTKRIKAARIVPHGEMLLFECPYCGMTLIKTSYKKARKLLEDTQVPRGKICENCKGAVIIKVSDEIKALIESKTTG